MKEFDILAVRVIDTAPWGISVKPDTDLSGCLAFIDKFKLPQWLEDERFPPLGAVLLATVVDASREPIRMSALDSDIAIAKGRSTGGL